MRWSLAIAVLGLLVQIGAAVEARRSYTDGWWWVGIGAVGFAAMVLGMIGVVIGVML